MELTQEQQAAMDAVVAWLADWEPGRSAPHFVLCGYAGTGKTTLMNSLLDEVGGATCATMTGKAMNVLKSKIGKKATCRTIHNLLYKPSMYQEQRLVDERAALVEKLEGASKSAEQDLLRQIAKLDNEIEGLSFALRDDAGSDSSGPIVVDEASMLSQYILDDLYDLNRPLLLVGDDMQLPPVKGKSVFESLGVDARLTQIHRQALDNPILALATAIREGDADTVNQWRRLRFDPGMASRADKVLCYTNKTRHNINRMLREERGYAPHTPVKGDKLICVHNVKGYSMINGGEAVATRDFENEYFTNLNKHMARGWVAYEDKPESEHLCSVENFLAHYHDPKKSRESRLVMDEATIPKMDQRYGDVRYFDYGYAITVHKAQGSEYDKVFLYDDAEWLAKRPGGMEQRQRWLYTAVTRAKEKLAWVK